MRWVFRCLVIVLLLAAGWYANIVFEWLPRESPEERAAISVLASVDAPSGGADGYAALWFLDRDIPAGDRARWLAADVEAWNRHYAAAADDADPEPGAFEPPSSRAFEQLPQVTSNWPWCKTWSAGCLARVRADPAAARADLAKFEAYEANVAALARYDHVIDPFAPSLRSPLPRFGNPSAVALTRAALTAIEDGPRAGLLQSCSYASTWRRLRAGSDHLLVDMLAVAQISGAAQLAAEIHAETQSATDWPPECTQSFAPLLEHEIVRCSEYAREFNLVMATHDSPELTVRGAKAVNWRHLAARVAPVYAHMCTATGSGSRRLAPAPSPRCAMAESLLDPFGCMLAAMADIDFSPYRDRVLDLDGRLATLRTALWLREQPGDPATAFANRPADLRTPEHEVAIDVAAGTLTMHAIDTAPERAEWTIPFARRDATPVSSRTR